ncbi:hypothetical protein GQ457_04G003740 [Hibiscus cannabinus]
MASASLSFLALCLLSLGPIFADSKPLPPLPVPPFHIRQAKILRYLGLHKRSIKLHALYVFGDSFVDAGNNQYLHTPSNANYLPYGIDFGGVPTGRSTNGRTIVDFIAQVTGLPFPPPVMGLSESQRKNITTGFNYASASGGISHIPPALAPIFGNILSLDQQIQLFKDSITDIKGRFDSDESFDSYMSKSLFFIHMGTNDLGIYWEFGKLHTVFPKVKDYTQLLSKEFHSGLEAMYHLGARKFVVNNVLPFGHQPVNHHLIMPGISSAEDMNRRAATFNKNLSKVLKKLNKSLKGSTFVLFDTYKLFEDVLAHPAAYGFTNVVDSCCIDKSGNQTRPCLPNSVPCSDRASHVFFDPFHPSESFNFLWLRRLLNNNSSSPCNLLQLIKNTIPCKYLFLCFKDTMASASLSFLALFLLSLGSIFADSKRLPPLPVPPFRIKQAEILRYLGLDKRSIKLPALYVFGDSFVDAGNNKYLQTPSNDANYLPYGIDFGGVPTGRATNGRTVVDFIAQVTGLPFPPPVMELSESQRKNITTGFNYASSSGGISHIPMALTPIFGDILNLDEQIQLFKDSITNIKGRFDSDESFDSYMSKSLFFINIGANDLGIYWELGRLHRTFPKVKNYTRFLLKELCKRLEAMYQLGARKFVVNNVFPFGYQPVNLHLKMHGVSFVEDMNRRAASFNGRLPKVLKKLDNSLRGSTFVLFDMYKLFEDVRARPATYGFTNVKDSCCIDLSGNQTRPCLPYSVPCSDRASHVFFDPFHPSESIHFLWLRRLLKDNSFTSPRNLLQLIKS